KTRQRNGRPCRRTGTTSRRHSSASRMKVWRLCWLGVRTENYAQTVALFRDVLGLTVEFEEPTTTELALPNGDRVQIFGPGDRHDAFFKEHARGPVALFEVDDVRSAAGELEAA